jgi:hypothetical protein
MGLTKKEEKLLKRLFQKRKNDLELAITHAIKQAEGQEQKGNVLETLQTTIAKFRLEVVQLNMLEERVFWEITKHENKDHSRQTIG